jgi:RNA-splicing ligase RtcB
VKTTYFTEKNNIEDNALRCLEHFEQESHIEKITVFPDIHYCSEKAIPVGVSFKTTDVFYPLITGKDMGCGVAYLRIDKKDYLKPFNKNTHYRAFERESHTMTDEGLGGGNHFLSIEESDDYLYIIVHTGSRNLGIYMYQQNYALLQEHNPGKEWLPIEFANEKYKIEYQRILDYATKRRFEFLQKTYEFLNRNGYINYPNYIKHDSCHNLLSFNDNSIIHHKGSTELIKDPIVIPLSMSRGSLIVSPQPYNLENSLASCSHGAGRNLSRTDTLKYWHSMKRSDKDSYKQRFSELLNRSGEFDSSILQEFDFAYKSSESILQTQKHITKLDETTPIVTVKFTGV